MQIDGLVTTVIPVFNRAAQLREAVESVLAQNYDAIEIVIVDDGSTDETGAVADAFAEQYPEQAFVIHAPNGGPGAARELGRLRARGEFIQYLDSDDVLLPGKFRQQTAALRADPSCDVAYGITRFRHADGRLEPGPWKRTGEKIQTMFPSFLVSRWWDTTTPLYRRSICDRAGPWLSTSVEEDWEYDCRVAALGAQLCYVAHDVCETRDHIELRLSSGRIGDSQRMRDRAIAHSLIYQSATSAGIDSSAPEMRHFARELFLLARQCGAAGLSAEARDLFALARDASGPRRGQGLDFQLYRLLASATGWSNAGRITCQLDKLRP